jgi:predicted N-formylglutamate amidohydrolase
MVGENATVIFEDDSRLAYTFSTKVKYKNKALNVVENMYYKNFKKGNYTVRVYDKSNLVSESSLVLR